MNINTPFRGVEVDKIVDFETGSHIGDGGIKSTQYGIYALGDIYGNNTIDSIGVFVGNINNYTYSISSNDLVIAWFICNVDFFYNRPNKKIRTFFKREAINFVYIFCKFFIIAK